MRVSYSSFIRASAYGLCVGQSRYRQGDTVAALLPNIPLMLELHYAVPLGRRAFLNTINTRLDAQNIRFILGHAKRRSFSSIPNSLRPPEAALDGMPDPPRVIEHRDGEWREEQREIAPQRLFVESDEDFRAGGDASPRGSRAPANEWDAITLKLYLRHDRKPEGRGLFPSRGLPDVLRHSLAAELGQHPSICGPCRCSIATDWCFPWVSLRRSGNPCLPPPCARRSDLRSDCDPSGDTSLWGTDRDVDTAGCQARVKAGHHTSSAVHYRRRPPPEAVLAVRWRERASRSFMCMG